MKNLLIYINPVEKKFDPEHEALTKIQIDNSLELGWHPQDILLVTNFDYTYAGIKSLVVGNYQEFDQNRSTKIAAINELFAKGLIEDAIYWFHDHDAFQLVPFALELKTEAGFTTHGAYSKTWNAGSFFFTKKAQNIFLLIKHYMDQRKTNEQNALTYLWENNIDDINSRYTLLDQSFNIGIYKIPENIKLSVLPLKVAHFHPHKKHHLDLFRTILPERLLEIFKDHGIN